VARFIQIEAGWSAFWAGFSAPALFLIFAWASAFRSGAVCLVLIIGILVGLEIPLVMRDSQTAVRLQGPGGAGADLRLSGRAGVSLLFPILLAPHLGLIAHQPAVRPAQCAGGGVGAVAVPRPTAARALAPGQCVAASFWRCWSAVLSPPTGSPNWPRKILYGDEIVLARTTPYQRIVVTRWKDDLRLFLNNNLQFSSRDEYRYHEALVHPGLSATPGARRVLVLGGGDGLAVREILRYPTRWKRHPGRSRPGDDPAVRQHPLLTPLNNNALNSPKLRIINADALRWLEENPGQFDFIVVDFPDPTNYSLGKLYSTVFYRLLEKHLAAQGAAVVQTTSPLYARQSFWCIVRTLESVGLTVTPYHAYVPAFGEWGFTLATRQPWQAPDHYPPGLRFLTTETTPALFQFPPDMGPVDAEINRLNNQILVRYYEQEWRRAPIFTPAAPYPRRDHPAPGSDGHRHRRSRQYLRGQGFARSSDLGSPASTIGRSGGRHPPAGNSAGWEYPGNAAIFRADRYWRSKATTLRQ
jgi:spermidine synthase